MFGNEGLVLVDSSAAPWAVTFDGVEQVIVSVSQGTTFVIVETTTGSPTEILLSYSGGGFVTGATSGLPLAPVEDFPVGIV